MEGWLFPDSLLLPWPRPEEMSRNAKVIRSRFKIVSRYDGKRTLPDGPSSTYVVLKGFSYSGLMAHWARVFPMTKGRTKPFGRAKLVPSLSWIKTLCLLGSAGASPSLRLDRVAGKSA